MGNVLSDIIIGVVFSLLIYALIKVSKNFFRGGIRGLVALRYGWDALPPLENAETGFKYKRWTSSQFDRAYPPELIQLESGSLQIRPYRSLGIFNSFEDVNHALEEFYKEID